MVGVPRISTERARTSRRHGRPKLVGLLAGVALTAAACGSSTSAGGSTTTTAAPAGGGGATVTVSTATVGSAGKVLVNGTGLTLYKFSLDKPGNIACVSSACVSTWPPLLVPAGDTLASMNGLATEKRPNGDTQVTYKGSPLYTFSGDSKAGQDNGATIPDWSVAATSATTSASTTPTTTSGGGYGY